MSYNYGPLEDGFFLCEINDKHHLQVPLNEFLARDGFIFRPILVSTMPAKLIDKSCMTA